MLTSLLHASLGAVVNVSPGAGNLQTAHDSASSGDELVLADGTYSVGPFDNNAVNIAKSITIRALNSGLAVLDGGGNVEESTKK